MVNQPNLSIPENLTPETRCFCLQIPDDPTWIQNFVGLLAQPTYWFNWDRDEARSGKILSEYWTKIFDQIDWSTMSCCCDNPPAIFRYNDEGVYQRSTDGGVTWVDAPEFDYRNISITFPPPSALGISTTKCQNADSAVVILNEDVIQGLDDGAAVQALLEFIAAVLIFYLSAGTLATVAIGLFSMAAAIVGFGVASTKAAFTSTVLDQLRCTIFCNMATDDSIDAAGLAAILVDINDNYTGIVKTSLYSIISAAGVVGITNMIRSNRGDAAADCSGCCPNCADLWSIFNGAENYGSIDAVAADNITVTLFFAPTTVGEYFARLKTPAIDSCCSIDHIDVLSGGPLNIFNAAACGHVQDGTFTGAFDPATGAADINCFDLGAAIATQVQIFFV